jgi:hypothetical protein
MAGAALLVTSLVPGLLEPSPPQASPADPVKVSAAVKSDRLAAVKRTPKRSTVSTVELVGVSQAKVILRDRDGRILFQADPLSNTTVLARDVDLPVLTVKDEDRSPVVQRPVTAPTERREESEQPVSTDRKRKTVGCEGPVSALARGNASMPGLCLVALPETVARS